MGVEDDMAAALADLEIAARQRQAGQAAGGPTPVGGNPTAPAVPRRSQDPGAPSSAHEWQPQVIAGAPAPETALTGHRPAVTGFTPGAGAEEPPRYGLTYIIAVVLQVMSVISLGLLIVAGAYAQYDNDWLPIIAGTIAASGVLVAATITRFGLMLSRDLQRRSGPRHW
jgi:hypothetical protein